MITLAVLGMIVGVLYYVGGVLGTGVTFDELGRSKLSFFFLIMGVTGLFIFILSTTDCSDIINDDNEAAFPFVWIGFIAVSWLYLLIAWLFSARKTRLNQYGKLIPYSEDRAMLLLSTPYWSNQVRKFRNLKDKSDARLKSYNQLRQNHKLPRLRLKPIKINEIKITFSHSRINIWDNHRKVLSIPYRLSDYECENLPSKFDPTIYASYLYHNPDYLSSWSIYLEILQTEIAHIDEKIKQVEEQIAYKQQLADNEKAEYVENIEVLAEVCQMTEQRK